MDAYEIGRLRMRQKTLEKRVEELEKIVKRLQKQMTNRVTQSQFKRRNLKR